MVRRFAFASLCAAALACPAGFAWAQAASAPSMASAPAMGMASAPARGLAHSDVSFMKDAAQAGMAEIEGSKLASTKASNGEVRSFADQMISDHGKVADELTTLAQSKGVTLPTEPSLTQRAKLKLLSSANGASFDKRYADSIGVSAHEDAVKLFRKASTSAKDADVKAFAAKNLPTLEHHLEMARSMQATVKGSH